MAVAGGITQIVMMGAAIKKVEGDIARLSRVLACCMRSPQKS
jgi:hypothetical protein